jgi:hypothetical protein
VRLLLEVTYYGSVVVLQGVFFALTGQQSLAVVASTLAIAALFVPIRRRLQGFTDRVNYRRKYYDSRKTHEAFSATLRDDTDLDAVSDDLVGVVSCIVCTARLLSTGWCDR